MTQKKCRDGFAISRRHNDVVQKVLRKARKGTNVVYIPGNHDEVGRQFTGLDFGQVAIREDAVHTLRDGRRLWVVHGDFADGVMLHARWLAYVGDMAYSLALWLNHHLNELRVHLGLGYWSLSQYLKHRVKNAVRFITGFEQVLLREARRRGYNGVVCGVVAGIGPALDTLKMRFPEVQFVGVLDQKSLCRLYSAADVFVFPSRTDTFGLVMLEALACGTPVATFPVQGPIDVVGGAPVAVLDEDLRRAALHALRIDRSLCREHASASPGASPPRNSLPCSGRSPPENL